MKATLNGKNIVIGVCGGIAAYKSVTLLRLLKKQDAHVRVIMTLNAGAFVGPLTFEALSGMKVCTSLFAENGEDASIKHIEWAQSADAVIIAPATANMIAKLAAGIADDALSTFLLAVTAPVMLCPSMNTHMFEHQTVKRNLKTLKQDGYHILAPDGGELACGVTGPGRLPEPEIILDRFLACMTPKDLSGRKILVTSGPTQEAIDPVRFISNPSSGKMGQAIARAAEMRGADVTLVSGPTSLTEPLNIKMIKVNTALEMHQAVWYHFEHTDIIIKAAAVSDYRPVNPKHRKIKKVQDETVLELQKNPDILKELGKNKGGRILVGFAAETEDLQKNAAMKLAQKNLDLIVGNLIGPDDSGFNADTNRVQFLYKDGTIETLHKMSKDAVAHLLLDRILQLTISS
ncbi:bifunctional phosphopantothenoylcysteine decarboxylase/phosphopantothenate--cysteine ligase CoaBC [Desulfococcaceae bacterium HSG7]|nr:bifunctional phosphopantothenoylcysteine decarboxylase/phosphopantothenate--cysteine ligase CoaBC [Desulfococcaceae bacterium HSG7]